MAVELGRTGVWASRRLLGDLGSAQVRDISATLEQAGYGALWVGTADADLATAQDVLADTTSLAYATGIVNVWTEPLDRVVAAYHRVDDAHPGRVLLGVGAGHREATQEYQKPYEKLVEYLDALAAAPRPVPVEGTALAALGPKVLALAADRTAGAHPYLVTPEHTATAREIMGPDALLAPEHKVVLSTDPTEARTIGRATVQFYLRLTNYVANLRRLGFTDDDFADGGSDRLVDAVVAWGDPETVATKVRAHLDAGANHVCVQVLTTGDGEAFPIAELRTLGDALNG
jgi:probable F420-dependent oxidoreductase